MCGETEVSYISGTVTWSVDGGSFIAQHMDNTRIAAIPSFPSPNMSKPESMFIPVPIIKEWPDVLHKLINEALLHLPDSPSRLSLYEWKMKCYKDLQRSQVSHSKSPSL